METITTTEIVPAAISTIVMNLMSAGGRARTVNSRMALFEAAYLVAADKRQQACKALAPLRTKASLAAIKAIKVL